MQDSVTASAAPGRIIQKVVAAALLLALAVGFVFASWGIFTAAQPPFRPLAVNYPPTRAVSLTWLTARLETGIAKQVYVAPSGDSIWVSQGSGFAKVANVTPADDILFARVIPRSVKVVSSLPAAVRAADAAERHNADRPPESLWGFIVLTIFAIATGFVIFGAFMELAISDAPLVEFIAAVRGRRSAMRPDAAKVSH